MLMGLPTGNYTTILSLKWQEGKSAEKSKLATYKSLRVFVYKTTGISGISVHRGVLKYFSKKQG